MNNIGQENDSAQSKRMRGFIMDQGPLITFYPLALYLVQRYKEAVKGKENFAEYISLLPKSFWLIGWTLTGFEIFQVRWLIPLHFSVRLVP